MFGEGHGMVEYRRLLVESIGSRLWRAHRKPHLGLVCIGILTIGTLSEAGAAHDFIRL